MHKILSFVIAILILSTAPAIGGTNEWVTVADMPTPRTEITASQIGNRIYVVGGFNAAGGTTDVIEVYDTTNNTWTVGKELPIALHHSAAASHEGKLYVVGGYSEGWIPSNKLFIYDLSTDEWMRGRDMPTSRGALTAQFVNGILYAVGGWNGIPLTVNEVYDPATNNWTTKVPMPTAREHLASGVIDDKLFVIGGRQGGLLTNLNVNEEYDPENNEWIRKASLPTDRGGIVAASLSDSIYVFGGETPLTTFYTNEQYIQSLDIWIVRERMPTARHGLAAAVVGGNIYVIGGGINPGLSVSTKNELFAPMDWKKTINVDVKPAISIKPQEPNTDDKIEVTISFETNTAGYFVKFNDVTRVGKRFTADVTVIPPMPNTVVDQVIIEHSHAYSLDELAVGDYMFSISINEQKRTFEEFSVMGGSKTFFIDVLEQDEEEISMGDVIVFQRNINNTANTEQSFIHILHVKDESGITVSLTWSRDELTANESRHISQTWIVESTGRYTLQSFVWRSIENPKILGSIHEAMVNVS